MGSSSATASIPGATIASDQAEGQGSVVGTFLIAGGSGPVNVNFSAGIFGSVSVFTDVFGESALAEDVFSLGVDGNNVLFNDTFLSIGADAGNQSQGISQLLTGTMTLQYDTPYELFIQADSEVSVSNVPEPGTPGILGAGALLLFWLKKKSFTFGKIRNKTLAGAAILLSACGIAQATYIGGDAPDICPTCGAQANRQAGGGAQTSLSEGNLRQDYPVCTVQSGYGPALQLSLVYNSYNADGSRAQVDSGLGLGWTLSYNIFLFQQRGSFFRMGADGRVTMYQLGFNGYTADNGYFETLTSIGPNSYAITNKSQSWWHFASIPNTPFLVGGPVYRLTQMGDRMGNVTTFTYDANGELIQTTDTYGRTLTYGYASKHLTSVTDPLGRTTMFQYDSKFRTLTRITDPAGNVTRYSYDSLYQMNRKIDRDGRTYIYTYKNQRPWAVMDGSGQSYFSMSNPANWGVNRIDLALLMRLIYTPSTTTSTDGNGHTWQYQYDTNGYVTKVTAPDGATTRYTYDPSTKEISSITNADGAAIRYQYDAEGNRTSMTDALGEVTTYTYDPTFNEVTSMTDPIGRITTYQYDAEGNRTQEVDALMHTNSWTYDSHGNVLSETDKNGHTTTYAYDAFGDETNKTDALGNVTTYAYDVEGNRIEMIDPLGRITRYQYDQLDREIGETNALGGITTYTYDPSGNELSMTDPNGNITSYQYDLRSRVIETTDPMGGTVTYGYDVDNNRIAKTNQLGNVMTYGYDSQNRMIETVDPMGGVMTYDYDPVGNRLSATDPNTNTTSYSYDALNREISMTNAIGGVTMYDYSSPGGPPCCSPSPGSSLMTVMIDPDGNRTYYHYDDVNRRVEVIRKNSDTNDVANPTDAVTMTTYDAVGNVIATIDPNTNTTVYIYDADNRKVSVIDAAGDTRVTHYDGDGNVIAVTAPNNNTTTNVYDGLNRIVVVYDEIGLVRSNAYDADGNILSGSDGLGNITTYTYDALNRQVQQTDPLGKTTTTVYDADNNISSITDRNGNTTQYAYDALDRRTTLTDPLGNTTVTTYDADSNVIGTIDADGHTTTYTYDGLNRRITETYPDTPPNTCTTTYDAVGNKISRVDQDGQVTTYTYNDLYYLTNRTYSPSGSVDTYTYDDGGRMLSANRDGWADTFTYDGANRVTSTTQEGQPLTYTYDIPSRVQTNSQPSGRVLIYTYDARNRLTTLQDNGVSPPIVTYVYDANNRVLTRTYHNGTTATYTYDADNRVISLVHSNATLIAGFNYAYDNEGNKLYEQKVDDPADSEAYLYDAMNRLTNYDVGTLVGPTIPAPAIARGWNLDGVGNWSAVSSNGTPEIRVHGPANELLTDNGSNYTYDANGNLTQDNGYNYTYDEENRLIQSQRRVDSEIVGQYFYDALGRRVKRITNPAGIITTNVYFYDDARLIEEQNPLGTAIARYTYGCAIDEVLTMDRPGQTFYYHQNTLWTPYALTDASGAVAERYTYDAYGYVTVLSPGYVILALNPWGTPHSAVANRFLYTGRELEEEDGLYFYRARYYDAVKGRFLQRDPIQDIRTQFNNLYEYVRSNPLNLTDPYGEQALDIRKTSGPARMGWCGGAWWAIQWLLDDKSKAGGWIMQDVTFTWKIQNCAGQDITANFIRLPNPLHYWEVWPVPRNSKVPNMNGDIFSTGNGYGLCTKGEISIEGSANFFEGNVRLPAGGGWRSPNPAALAGILYATTTDPTSKDPFKNPDTLSIDHILKISWNCCVNVARRTQLVDQTP